MLRLLDIARLVNRIVEKDIPTRLRHRIKCGIQAFSLQEFSSINANGRSLSHNRKTGETRVYRAIHDPRMPEYLGRLIKRFLPQSPLILCSLDHSQFGIFCIAVLSVTTRKGRAIPIWVQINISEAGLIDPLLKELENLREYIGSDQRLVLVMDRWFCGPKLFNLLIDLGWYFICRAKYDRRVMVPWNEKSSIPIGEISHLEVNLEYRGIKLRMVRSEMREDMKQNEPWFLLTNLPEELASRVQVIHAYENRFECEELYKDLKWLNRLEWQQCKKPESIHAILLFTFLGWWIAWHMFRNRQELRRKQKTHPKHRLSWFRIYWEELRRLCWPEPLRFTPLRI